jgi:hypothetical protein
VLRMIWHRFIDWLLRRGWLPAGESNDGERDL